jgi:hypothetical protein
LELDLRRQRWQQAIAWLALCTCAAAPGLLGALAIGPRLAIAIIATAVCAMGLRRARWWPGHVRFVRLRRSDANHWLLTGADSAARLERELHPSSRYFRHFVWLRFVDGPALIIGPGDLAADQFRRLQVVLRHPPLAAEPVA